MMSVQQFIGTYQRLAKYVKAEVIERYPECNLDDETGEFKFSLSLHTGGCLLVTPTYLSAGGIEIDFENVVITFTELNEMLS